MAYFPFYVELKDVSVLIVGGGKVALHKVKRILDYGPKIKVVAKKVDERIKNIKGVEWEEREFEDSDVEGVRFVIAAAGDEELDEHITSLCSDVVFKCLFHCPIRLFLIYLTNSFSTVVFGVCDTPSCL